LPYFLAPLPVAPGTPATVHGLIGPYVYHAFGIDTEFLPNQPGNYSFAYMSPTGLVTVLYIGECDDLATRCTNQHEKNAVARPMRANAQPAHLNDLPRQFRLPEEKDIRDAQTPVLNLQ